MTAADDVRMAVYGLALKKFSQNAMAEKTGKSRATVQHHLKALVAHGVLLRKGRGPTVSYRRGIKAAYFEDAGTLPTNGRWDRGGIEVHNARWKFSIVPGHFAAPVHAKRSDANGMTTWTWEENQAGFGYMVQVHEGKRNVSCQVRPKRAVVSGPSEMEGWHYENARAVGALADRMRAKYSWKLPRGADGKTSGPVWCGKDRIEAAIPLALDVRPTPKVEAGEGAAWIDTSPGKPELEVSGMSHAIAAAELPEKQEEQDRRLSALEARSARQEAVAERLLGIQERTTGAMEAHNLRELAVAEALQHQATGVPAGSEASYG